MKTDELIIAVAFHKITRLLCIKFHLSKNVWNTLLAGARTSLKMPDIVQFGLYVGCQGQWKSAMCLKDSVDPATNLL